MSRHASGDRLSATLDRRRLIGAGAGIAATSLLAGRAAPGAFGRAVVTQDGANEFHAAWPYLAPPTGHYNDFVTDAIMKTPNIYGDMIYQPFALYYWESGEWLPLMATSWAFITRDAAATPIAEGESTTGLGRIDPGADTFQVRLREGAVWSDGSPFTARDVLTTFSIQRLMSNVVWQYLEAVEAVDDYTVNFMMSAPSTVVQRYVLRMSTQSTAIYGDWARQADEFFASGQTLDDPVGRQLLEAFVAFRPDQVIASGPFTIDLESVTEATLALVKNDQAWNAGQVLFDRIFDYNGRGQEIITVILTGIVDYGTQAFSPAVEAELLQGGQRIVRPPIFSGPAIFFNFGRFPQLADTRVRQAIAHVIDRGQNGFLSLGESGVGVQTMCGMSDNLVTTWLSEEDAATLNTYPLDTEQATALLTEAGWTKDGDRWVMADGTPAAFEMTWPAEFPDWSAAGVDAVDQLNLFGFEITARGVTVEQQPIDVDRGAFDWAIRGWGSSSNPHPHFSYTQALFTHNTLAINNGGQGMQFPLVQQTDVAGEVDLEALTIDSARGLDEAAQRADVTTVAQVFNELLPVVPLWERYGNNSIVENVRTGAWPPDDDPIYRNSVYADGIVTMLMLTGTIRPAGS